MNEDIIELEQVGKDLKEIKPSINLMKSLPPAIKRPTFTYRLPTQSNTRKSGEAWYPGEYDFVDIGMAEDTDSFVYQANFKKLALAIKAGWVFVSRDQESLDYIKRRIAELEIAQGQSFWALLVEVFSNLLRYHNCFLIKARDVTTSSGKVRDVDGFKLKPIAGYFVASPETMLFQIGKDYNIKGYKHIMPDGREKVFAPEDVIHFHIYRKTHQLVGTPSWVPVLDDVTALRRIEENIENLVHQHIHPLFQYKVGTENAPMKRFEDGLTECDIVRAKIQDMSNDGIIVTPERHEIKGLGSESRALRAETYLEYFKKRVISGSGLSELDFGYGDTSNRACYSEDTETLTENGWKHYWEIMSGEKIATFNPENNELEYHEPENGIFLYDYEGPMYHFKNRNVDTLVTPDHDMWVGHRLWEKTEWTKIHAEDIELNRFDFRTGGVGWAGVEPEDFLLPHVPYKSNIRCSNQEPFDRIPISDWLEFLGYYVSEGCLAKAKNKWAITISQNSTINQEKCQKIRDCLNRLPFKFNEYTNPGDHTTRFWINCKSLYLYLEENCKDYSYLKQFPDEVLTYSAQYLRIAFEAAMTGDGTTDKRAGRSSRAYYSTSEKLIDQVQEIAIKLGYRAHVLPGSKCSRVSISIGDESEVRQGQIEVVNYKGKVYCFRVPNHLFFTRRNGRIGIHGNTADTMSKLAIDNVKFYQQCMADIINFFMVRELMLESTFSYDHSDDEQRVELQFNEIDVESQMKLQNHYMLLYQGHIATESETRKHIGKEPLSDDHREDTFLTRVEKQKADWQAQADVDKANAVAKNRQQPTNQYGKKSGPGKRKSSVERDSAATEAYNQLAADIKRFQGNNINLGFIHQLFLATAERAKTLFQTSIESSVLRGARSYPLTLGLRLELEAINKRIRREFETDVDRLFRDAAIETQAQLIDKEEERLAIDILEYRIRFIERTLLHKAYILGKVAAMRSNGIQRAMIKSDPDGEDYEIWHNIVIDLNDLSLENLPPFHPNCSCDLEPELSNV